MYDKIPPGGGTTWSRSLGLVLFQIFLITALSSAFASSIFPSVLILNEVLTTANSVALNRTVPSLFNGMFIETSLWKEGRYRWRTKGRFQRSGLARDTNFTCDAVRAEFTETQRRRYLSEKSDHVQMLDTTFGVGVVLGPETNKLVQMVGTQDGPISRQVIEIIHDYGDEQIDDLKLVRSQFRDAVFDINKCI